jgi:hypothetical protein
VEKQKVFSRTRRAKSRVAQPAITNARASNAICGYAINLKVRIKMEEQHLQTGKLYKFDGNQLVELEPSAERKIPITEDAHQNLSKIRNSISKVLGFRPELSLIASAMIVHLSNDEKIHEIIKEYAVSIYMK